MPRRNNKNIPQRNLNYNGIHYIDIRHYGYKIKPEKTKAMNYYDSATN